MPARQLVIDYVLEGHQRGYNFTSSTDGYSDAELKLIWRRAMPRGQGWSQYIGARSLKCFPLDGQRRAAVCETVVTAQRDEHGRGGIRQVTIDVLPYADYFAYLDQRLLKLPDAVRTQVDRMPTFSQRLSISNSLMTHKKDQLVLLHPYNGPDRWQIMEGFLVKLALAPLTVMRRWGPVVSLTTLALNHQEESALVALPAEKAVTIDRKTPSIKV